MHVAKLCLRLPAFFLILILLAGCGASSTIVHNLDEREANEILTYLNDRGIEAQKTQAEEARAGGGGGVVLWNITVSRDRANEAMALLNTAGLPRRPGQSLLTIFAPSSMVPSELQEQIRYQSGLAAQLSNVIRKFDGVLDADVTLSFPKEDPLNPNAPKGIVTASVYVKHTGVLDDPNSHLETKIKRLLANSVTGLNFDNVTVVGERSRYADASGELTSVTGTGSEKPLVSVWSIIVAKESLTRFRVIFFSFFVSILVLLAILAWLAWKLFPLFHRPDGLYQLFSLHPLPLTPPSKTEAEEEGEPKPETAEVKKPEGTEEEGEGGEERRP